MFPDHRGHAGRLRMGAGRWTAGTSGRSSATGSLMSRSKARDRAAVHGIAVLLLQAALAACASQPDAPAAAPSPKDASPTGAPAPARVGRIRADLKDGPRFTIATGRKMVTLRGPDGREERMAWADVVRIVVVTTDEGPMLSDVFTFLESARAALVIPQDAVGNESFTDALTRVAGFNNGAFIAAMTSDENAEFECWSGPKLGFRPEGSK